MKNFLKRFYYWERLKILRHVEMILTPDTWMQGKYYYNGKYCLIGAIRNYYKKNTLKTNFYLEADYYLIVSDIQDIIRSEMNDNEFLCVESWNDKPERNWCDITNLFQSLRTKYGDI